MQHDPEPTPDVESVRGYDPAYHRWWERVRRRGKVAFVLAYGVVGAGVPLTLLTNLAILRARGDWDLVLSTRNAFELTLTLLLVAPVAGVIVGRALWAQGERRLARAGAATASDASPATAVVARTGALRDEDPDAPVRISPPRMRASGTADRIFLHARAEDAQHKAVFAVVACVAAVVAWGWLGEFALHSITFFGVGIALLWAFGTVSAYRELRRAANADEGGDDPESPERAALVAAHQAWVERHHALRAERPPRMTYGLLGCITVASVLQAAAHGRSVEAAGIVKSAVRDYGQWWRLLTGTYLHAGLWHFWMNAGALKAFGAEAEAFAPRLRLPLAYLVAALTGSVASLLLSPDRNSVGASGGILGVVAFLFVLAHRRPAELPPWMRQALLTTFALTAYLGFFGLAFIDNAAHAGGVVGGALVGFAAVPPAGATASKDRERLLDVLGVAACAVLVAGALYAVRQLLAAA